MSVCVCHLSSLMVLHGAGRQQKTTAELQHAPGDQGHQASSLALIPSSQSPGLGITLSVPGGAYPAACMR